MSKGRFSTQLPDGLADEGRGVVLELQRSHPGVTLSSFTADALVAALAGVKAGTFQVTTGSPFRLRPGRGLAHSTGMSASVDDGKEES